MILRSENLNKKYKSRTVANNVSLQVQQGEIVGLLGPNGAGKTTSFYMIVGMVKPNSGKIFLDNIKYIIHIYLDNLNSLYFLSETIQYQKNFNFSIIYLLMKDHFILASRNLK